MREKEIAKQILFGDDVKGSLSSVFERCVDGSYNLYFPLIEDDGAINDVVINVTEEELLDALA